MPDDPSGLLRRKFANNINKSRLRTIAGESSGMVKAFTAFALLVLQLTSAPRTVGAYPCHRNS